MILTSGAIAAALRPGLHEMWGLGKNMRPEEYSQIFEKLSTNLNYERDQQVFGLGLAQTRPEGTATNFDSMGQGFHFDYVPVIYSKGVRITHQAIINNQYMQVAADNMKEMGRAMQEAKEIVHANILNNAFDNSVTYADGLQLCSSAHLLAAGGTFSNVPATDADLSEAMLEEAVINIEGYTDDRGKKVLVRPRKLIVHPNDQFEAARILKSELRVGTADNDINVLKSGMYLPEGFMVYHYLTDSDAFFILTDTPKGLRSFQREAVRFDDSVDFETDDLKIKGVEQYSVGVTDVMAIYGCQGG